LHSATISKNEYFLLDNIDNSEKIITNFHRVSSGEPIQYVLNLCEFYGREFYVDNRVLIPRIDTEVMIDAILAQKYPTTTQYIDIGTGSGIIPITIASELRNHATMYAGDISKPALKVAKKNALIHGLKDDIFFFETDLLSALSRIEIALDSPLVITANLPYIKNADFANMSESTIQYEPNQALY
jgi:release factor glutamine methyltransferase